MADARLDMRVLAASHATEVHELHCRIVETLPHPALMYRRDRAFFADLLAGGGAVIGACGNGRLVGYAALRRARGHADSYARLLGVSEAAHGRILEGVGTGIDPAARGRRLFGPLIEARCRYAREVGFAWVFGMIWSGNIASLLPHLRRTYAAIGMVRDRDGENFVIAWPSAGWRRRNPPPVFRRALADFAGMRTAFARGHMLSGGQPGIADRGLVFCKTDPRLTELR